MKKGNTNSKNNVGDRLALLTFNIRTTDTIKGITAHYTDSIVATLLICTWCNYKYKETNLKSHKNECYSPKDMVVIISVRVQVLIHVLLNLYFPLKFFPFFP